MAGYTIPGVVQCTSAGDEGVVPVSFLSMVAADLG